MLHKKTSHRDCNSNYSQSISNLHNYAPFNFDLKEFSLKKSLFNPPEGLAESFAARRHIAGADVPVIDVVHYSKRWLLIQTPRFSRSFFKRLNSTQLGNPYEQLLKLFKNFAALTKIYGFFRPTVGMIFMERRTIRVWINEDVFSGTPMIPLGKGLQGQRQFVEFFMAMIEREVKEWQHVNNIYTIEDMSKLLDWRSKINRGSFTAIKASKQVFYPPNESNLSFDVNELGQTRKLLAYRSVQNIKMNDSHQCLQPNLTNSVTMKEQEHKLISTIPNKRTISGLFSDSRELKNSYSETKGIDFANEVRRTKKKFNLASTSSTLERFSQRWRSTAGKKTKKALQIHGSIDNEQYSPPTHTLQHRNTEPLTIQHEFEGLFNEDQNRQLKLGFEGDRQELQKIAEQIQQVLIW